MSAADKMNDFQPVAFGKVRPSPQLAWNDLAIEFNGNTIVLHSQLVYQRGER